MNKRNFRAGLIACLMAAAALAASPATADDKPVPGPKVSGPVGKALAPAQTLLQAKDYKGALPLIQAAQALPDQTDADKYVINEFLANAAIGLQDYPTADTAYEAMAESPALPADARQGTFKNATILANQYKHLDAAIKYGTAYLAMTPTNPDAFVLGALAQAYYSKDDYPNAQSYAQKAVDATPAGKSPNQGALQVLAYSQIKQKNTEGALKAFETMVTYYNDQNMWGDLINLSFAGKGISDIEGLHIYRLRLATHAVGQADSYTFPAQIALNQGWPVEAQAFLDAGNAAGVVPGGGPTYGTVRARAAQDRSVLTSYAGIAHKAATGELDLKLAETYYGYGRYADAEAAAQEALQKGGAKVDRNEAQMVIGESLAMEGKGADAVAAFNAMSNPPPGWAKAQHLWLIFANRKYAS